MRRASCVASSFRRFSTWPVLGAVAWSCGGVNPAPAPPPQSAPTTADAAVPSPPPAKPPEASPPPEAAFPPAPWVVAAIAPAERRFQRYQLGKLGLWAACHAYEMSGGCLQPEFAIERPSGLEPTNALARAMPTLEYVDLRKEPEGHWSRIRHKEHRSDDPCAEDTYFGPRAMTGLYGSFPDDVWMTVDRSGEEYVATSVTTVYRLRSGAWTEVGATKKLGDRITRLSPWKKGMLALVETDGMPTRFEAFAARPGAVVPLIPKDTTFDRFAVQEDGTVLAAEARMDITLYGWTPQSPTAARLPLRAVLYGYDDRGELVFAPDGEVDVRGYGALPIAQKASGEFRPERIHAKLRFARGRWKVVEEKLWDWRPAAPDTGASPKLDGVAGFSQQEELASPDGSRWIAGTLRIAGEEKAVLLHDRPVVRDWRVSGAPLKDPAHERPSDCTRLGPSPPVSPGRSP